MDDKNAAYMETGLMKEVFIN